MASRAQAYSCATAPLLLQNTLLSRYRLMDRPPEAQMPSYAINSIQLLCTVLYNPSLLFKCERMFT